MVHNPRKKWPYFLGGDGIWGGVGPLKHFYLDTLGSPWPWIPWGYIGGLGPPKGSLMKEIVTIVT